MPLIPYLASILRHIVDSRIVLQALEVIDGRSDNRMSERGMLRQAFEFISINRVQGDYFEFGLWQGKTFKFAHRMKRRFQFHHMVLRGFDSFQGLPPIQEQADNIWHEGEYACSEVALRQILRRSGFKIDEYDLVGGFYDKSLNEDLHKRLAGKTAAIVYVDCDLYESTIQVLEFIKRYLITGSIVCFDDFYTYKGAPDKGEQLALNVFLEKHPNIEFIPYLNYCPVGKSFIVRHWSV